MVQAGCALYQPGIAVFDRDTNELKYVIEVQRANVRKSIAGATNLAEICVEGLRPKVKLHYA